MAQLRREELCRRGNCAAFLPPAITEFGETKRGYLTQLPAYPEMSDYFQGFIVLR